MYVQRTPLDQVSLDEMLAYVSVDGASYKARAAAVCVDVSRMYCSSRGFARISQSYLLHLYGALDAVGSLAHRRMVSREAMPND